MYAPCKLCHSLQHTPYMEATLNQQIPGNTSIMDSGNVSVGSVGSMPSTETPPPGYMSEDGDPMDQNDNMSESIVGINHQRKLKFSKHYPHAIQFDGSYICACKKSINSFFVRARQRYVKTYAESTD